MGCCFRKAAAALFLLAVATPAWSETAPDPREPTVRTSEERALVFGQMRLFLETIAALQDDLAQGYMAKVAADAASRGAKEFSKASNPPGLSEKETVIWKQLARAMRLGFDSIADKARAGASKEGGDSRNRRREHAGLRRLPPVLPDRRQGRVSARLANLSWGSIDMISLAYVRSPREKVH